MPRFIRETREPEGNQDEYVADEQHPELVALVNAYATPLVPDPQSPLSAREQHLTGIVRPRRIRDLPWRRIG
jgi:hypothetical protein